jgi:nitroreductase/NAD-dependent dihydropyrimidine dehydrogenase PreA subunit
MMKVDLDKCIGCGICSKDCIVHDIKIVQGRANMKNRACVKCGHCIAICPKNAVSTDDYDATEIKEFNKEDFYIESENLLNFIKFRRSIRNFKDKEVEFEKINKIIEAGRFTQTGGNTQNVSYIIVKDKLQELRELALESLNQKGAEILSNPNIEDKQARKYAPMWIKMYEEFKQNPNGQDKLFFKAPIIIIVTSDSEVNGALASSNMELMTNTLGLGTVFSGFLVRASQGNDKISNFLGLNPNDKIITCMVIGYPNTKYFRTVPRKEANVSWL